MFGLTGQAQLKAFNVKQLAYGQSFDYEIIGQAGSSQEINRFSDYVIDSFLVSQFLKNFINC